MLGEGSSQGAQVGCTGNSKLPPKTRKRKHNFEDTPTVHIKEKALSKDFRAKEIDVLEKLDNEYEGWRDDSPCKKRVIMVPNTYINKGKGNNDKNGSDAERKMYSTLQNSYRDQTDIRHYFHPKPKENQTRFVFHAGKYDGNEIDFILVDRIKGVFIFECKGVSNARQAQSRYNSACSQLTKSVPKVKLKPDVNVHQVVAFPLCKRTQIREQGGTSTLFAEDCKDVRSFQSWLESKSSGCLLSHDKYVEILKLLLSHYHVRGKYFLSGEFKRGYVANPASALETATKRETATFLSKEQVEIAEINNHGNIWVKGPAGSGKTFLLKRKVKALAELYEELGQKPGKTILILTYNKGISEEIRYSLYEKQSWIEVRTYTSLLRLILNIPNGHDIKKNDAEHVAKILKNPSLLSEYLRKIDSCGFRYIFVDEAQDFDGDWLDVINRLRYQPVLAESSIWVFSDAYQAIRYQAQNRVIAEKLEKFPVKRCLTNVVRNTHEVFKTYDYYFEDERFSNAQLRPSVSHEVYGAAPKYESVLNNKEAYYAIKNEIELLRKEKIPMIDVAIIAQNQNVRDKIAKFFKHVEINWVDAIVGAKIKLGYGHTVYDQVPDNPVILESLQRFKGLESKVLIFCILNDWEPRDVDLYVGFSRAFCRLVVIGIPKFFQELRSKKECKSAPVHEMNELSLSSS